MPEDPSKTVRVRVLQDKATQDYEDVSNGDLEIVSTGSILGDGFETGTTAGWTSEVP